MVLLEAGWYHDMYPMVDFGGFQSSAHKGG